MKTWSRLFYAIERSGHIGLLHESEMNLCAPKTFTQTFQRDAILRIGQIRNLFSSDGEQDNVLV